MNDFIFVRHEELSETLRKQIIAIKQQHWIYSVNSQFEWMNKNLKNTDSHLLLYFEGKPIAYLNLVEILVSADKKIQQAIGLGNVSVDKDSRGCHFGKKIILKANEILKDLGKSGFLLCNKSLVGFYEKAEWRELYCNKVFVAGKNYGNLVMTYNSQFVNIQNLTFDRNF